MVKVKEKKQLTLAEKFLKEIENQVLAPAQHNSSVMVQASGWNLSKYFDKYYKDRTKFPFLIIVKGKDGIMNYPFTKLVVLTEEFFADFWKNPNILKKREQEFYKFEKITNTIYKKLSYKYIKKTKIDNLIIDIKKSFAATINLNALLSFSLYFDEDMYKNFIKKFNINIPKKNLKLVWKIGSNPPIFSFESNRNMEIIQAFKSGKNFSSIIEDLQYIGASYGLIKSIDEVKKELETNFKDIIMDSTKIESHLNNFIEDLHKKEKEHNFKIKKLSLDEKKFILFLNKIIEFRDKRKDLFAKMSLTYFRVAEKLFEKYHVPKNLIYFYRFDELVKGEKYFKIKIDDLYKRQKGYCCLINYNGKIEESFDFEKNKEILDRYRSSKIDIQNEIIGQIAYKGNIKGKVKIVLNQETFSEFKKGEILVTGMTRPEFVPLMKKASAIITDEGGITCHAAIIARELKKPCIIGTKNATQILKDGDLVEVDADKGIVKILKKK